jgi:hypothetical protein
VLAFNEGVNAVSLISDFSTGAQLRHRLHSRILEDGPGAKPPTESGL